MEMVYGESESMGNSKQVVFTSNESEAASGVKQSILLVDDDEVTLKIMKAHLQKQYVVNTVSNGYAALKLLSQQSVDLILLDYMMPEMDGPTVFQRIREDFPNQHIPIVFLTGVADRKLVIKGLVLQPLDYLLKPVTQKDLLERVSKVLKKI